MRSFGDGFPLKVIIRIQYEEQQLVAAERSEGWREETKPGNISGAQRKTRVDGGSKGNAVPSMHTGNKTVQRVIEALISPTTERIHQAESTPPPEGTTWTHVISYNM